jgi:hypothetical protein
MGSFLRNLLDLIDAKTHREISSFALLTGRKRGRSDMRLASGTHDPKLQQALVFSQPNRAARETALSALCNGMMVGFNDAGMGSNAQ